MKGDVAVAEREDGILGQQCKDCTTKRFCFIQFIITLSGRSWVRQNVDLSEFIGQNGECNKEEVLAW